jgi:alpha-1,2-mannosyltransferase
MIWRQRLARLLTWRRARAWALVLVALYLVAWIDVLVLGSPPLNSVGAPMSGDYIAFHTAARLIAAGQAAQMYDHATVVSVQDDLLHGAIPNFYDAYRNPPFFALAYLPMVGLDLLPAFAVWFAISLACLGLAIKLLLDEVPSLQARWAGVLIFVFAFAPVYFGLIDGENATVSLLLYALIYRAFARGQDRALGVWAALGLFKPQLFLVFPLVFLITRRWRSLLWYALTVAVLFGVSLMLVGAEGMQAWVRTLLEHESGNALANNWRMASAKSLFDALLPGLGVVSLLFYAAVSVALLIVLWQVWRRPEVNLPVAFAMTTLIAVLIDPHLVDYDLTVLVAAGIVAGVLVRRYALVILPLYVLTLLRAQIPVGDATIQLTAPLLAVLTVWMFWEIRSPIASESVAESTAPLLVTAVNS